MHFPPQSATWIAWIAWVKRKQFTYGGPSTSIRFYRHRCTAILYGKYCHRLKHFHVVWTLVAGFYCLLFGLYWRIQLTRADRLKNFFFMRSLLISFSPRRIYQIFQVQFNITVSTSRTEPSDMSPNSCSMRLIFEFVGLRAEPRFIGTRWGLVGHRR